MKKLLLLWVFGALLFVGLRAQSTDIIDRYRIESIVEYLSSDDFEGREIGTIGEKRAGDFIETIFQYNGIAPGADNGSYFQVFKVDPKTNPHSQVADSVSAPIIGRNVLGWIDKGSEKTIVLGAHYDHLGYGSEGSLYMGDPAIHNGADDNASGVAGVIELGRLLQNMDIDHNVLLLAFSGEEKGLWGSNYFTKNPSLSLENIAFMVNMDMIGRLSENKKLAVHGVGTSPVFEEVLVRNNQNLDLKIVKSGSGPSDHSSFYYSDVPVLSFFTGQHEDYHKPSDDEHLINYEGMADVLELILRVIVDLDNEGDIPFQKTKDESQEVPRFKVTLGVMPDYMFSGKGMRIDGVREGKTADSAGLKKGDVVMKMGDIEVVDMMSYMKALSAFEKGQETEVEVLREGKKIKTTVVFQ